MNISDELKALFKEYGGDPKTDLWDCHGSIIAKHSWLEKVAAKAGITFDVPAVMEHNAKEKIVSCCVTGRRGERVEWSFGEAAPYNNKNAYPYAMAEKRAKDRVTLKLLNLHGEVYSEEEAEDFKKDKQKSAYQARKDGDYEHLRAQIDEITNAEALKNWGKAQKDMIEKLPDNWQDHLREHYEARLDAIKGMAA